MNRRIIFLILSLFLIQGFDAKAQPAYGFRVKFKDKNGSLTFADSLQFLSPKSLARRSAQGIPLDSSDLPLVQAYIDTVITTAAAVNLHNRSKWFNQIVVVTYDSSKINDILALPMVASAQCVAVWQNGNYHFTGGASTKYPDQDIFAEKKTRGSPAYYANTYTQVDLIQADCLHDLGYKGENMDIAVFDINFRFANTCYYFDTLNQQNRIKDTWSYVRDTSYVFDPAINTGHGKDVLGCMAGNIPGVYVGTAPYANFHLYISEDVGGERPIEEDNWLSAAERADSIGIKVVNSSLGYNTYDAPLGYMSYTYAQHLDGKTTMVAQALNKLSTKGVVVVQAAGNEGCANWHYLLTPADADSSLTTGSVDGSGIWACSGVGPNVAGVVKPDVMCMGKAVMLIPDACTTPGSANGSSFASPTMCGAVACLWQAFPNLTAVQIKQVVRMASDRYANPTNTEGYGIPNFCTAYSIATGTSDIQQMDYTFAVYPNPVHDGSFKIKSFTPSTREFSFTIYDLKGTLVYQSNKINNEVYSEALKQVPSGEYLLIVTSGGKEYRSKLVK